MGHSESGQYKRKPSVSEEDGQKSSLRRDWDGVQIHSRHFLLSRVLCNCLGNRENGAAKGKDKEATREKGRTRTVSICVEGNSLPLLIPEGHFGTR